MRRRAAGGDAAPALCVSHTQIPGGAGDPPGGTTTPRDWFADMPGFGPDMKSAAPVTEKRCDGAPVGARPPGSRTQQRKVWRRPALHPLGLFRGGEKAEGSAAPQVRGRSSMPG